MNRSPRLILVAHEIHARTRDALSFLADSGVPVAVIPVTVYEAKSGQRLVEIEQESVVTTSLSGEGGTIAGTQKSYTYNGHAVRIADLVTAGLLSPGTDVEFTRQGKTTKGTITPEGDIQVGDQHFSTPSAAGTATVGYPVDGWVSWRVPSLSNAKLADLRQKLLDRDEASDDPAE